MPIIKGLVMESQSRIDSGTHTYKHLENLLMQAASELMTIILIYMEAQLMYMVIT